MDDDRRAAVDALKPIREAHGREAQGRARGFRYRERRPKGPAGRQAARRSSGGRIRSRDGRWLIRGRGSGEGPPDPAHRAPPLSFHRKRNGRPGGPPIC